MIGHMNTDLYVQSARGGATILVYYTVKYCVFNWSILQNVKTQLKSFFCDLLFSTKMHPSYGKEHSVKIEPSYL